jgi:hypothetical protein
MQPTNSPRNGVRNHVRNADVAHTVAHFQRPDCQFSTRKPGTRENSRKFPVTRIAPTLRACPANDTKTFRLESASQKVNSGKQGQDERRDCARSFHAR